MNALFCGRRRVDISRAASLRQTTMDLNTAILQA
jgi:hypothetical protein